MTLISIISFASKHEILLFMMKQQQGRFAVPPSHHFHYGTAAMIRPRRANSPVKCSISNTFNNNGILLFSLLKENYSQSPLTQLIIGGWFPPPRDNYTWWYSQISRRTSHDFFKLSSAAVGLKTRCYLSQFTRSQQLRKGKTGIKKTKGIKIEAEL